jgi:gamma-glutamyltranspeptidase/glutathione hydrolase/leukotriene-C4 hydrolase
LKGFEAIKYPAIQQTYHGKTIYTTNAPSSQVHSFLCHLVLTARGGVMLGMLNILEPYNFAETGCLDSSINTHLLIEAMKFAFGARSEITDPTFAKNMTRINEFYTKEWSDEIRPKLDKVSSVRFDLYKAGLTVRKRTTSPTMGCYTTRPSTMEPPT